MTKHITKLPEIFYSVLKGNKFWNDRYVNHCHVLISEDLDRVFTLWPSHEKFYSNKVDFECMSIGNISFLVRIEHENMLGVANTFNVNQRVSPFEILILLSKIPAITLISCKFKSLGFSFEKIIDVNTIVNMSNPQFKEVSSIKFYLASKVESSLLIKKENIDPVARKLCENNDIRYESFNNFSEIISDLYYASPTFNEKNDLIDFPFGGDIWPIEDMDCIKEYVEPNSSIILQDDCNIFFKIMFTPQKLFFFEEDIEKMGYNLVDD